MLKRIESNPSGIQPGETCYGIYLPAFTPEAMLKPMPGSKDVIPGKAVSSYDCRPKNGDGPAAMFLPDSPFPDTDIMGATYDLCNWAISRSRTEALASRAALAKKAMLDYSAEMGLLKDCI